MIDRNEISKALDGAFHAASVLTVSTQAAEHAVLDGIAATEFDSVIDDAFLLETAKAAIQQRPDFPQQSPWPPSHLPVELQRLFLLAPISRDCFVLQILVGITPRTCSAMLDITTEETQEALGALALDGSLTTLGYSASRKATIDVTNLIWQRASIKSFALFAQPQAAWAEAWNTIVPMLQSGAIKPIVAKTFPLAEAAHAPRYLVEGRPFGRVVLTV
jgi:hypothetical protein